jgi:demethylmenaquinone methyltransferase/2-methoxy-6-polyprenyl-1,4-benzoquinol methylase
MKLPFADNSFDAATISFGLRNVQDPTKALAEMARVTRPGGRLVVCEFSHPTWVPFRTLYLEYLMKALPSVATKISSNPDAYVYLAESIRAWPNQVALSKMILASGWQTCEYRDLTGGIVAIHRATK